MYTGERLRNLASCFIKANAKANEDVQHHLQTLSSEERSMIQKVLERDKKLQNEIASNIPQTSVKILPSNNAEEDVKPYLASLSYEEREIIQKVIEKDRNFQNEIANSISQDSVKIPLNHDTFSGSLDSKGK